MRGCRVSNTISIALAGCLVGLTGQGGSVGASDPPPPVYEQEIKPILVRRCTICHSAKNQDDPDLSGGLALDSFEAILAGTKRHNVILPGQSAQSELVRRLSDQDEDRRMPLQEDALPQAQRDLIRRWIDAGAPRGFRSAATSSVPAGTTPLPSRRQRRVPALDVVIPTNVKLAPKTLNTTRGGPLAIVLPVGPLPAVRSLAFRGDNRLLAVGTYGQVMLWDLVDGQPAGVILGIPGPVHALAFSRDGRRLAVGAGLPARSGLVRVYSVPDDTLIHEFSGHKDVVFAVAMRPDGAQLASASFDQTVRLWDLAQCRASRDVSRAFRFRLRGDLYPGRPASADCQQGHGLSSESTAGRSKKNALTAATTWTSWPSPHIQMASVSSQQVKSHRFAGGRSTVTSRCRGGAGMVVPFINSSSVGMAVD